ncbi:transporter [Rhodoplanes sp.]|uniref:transporter n=1 Tax=Rhodoplanes sp. TaxID=1968906 RepID=UPI00345BFF5F
MTPCRSLRCPPNESRPGRVEHGSILGGKIPAAWVTSQWKSTGASQFLTKQLQIGLVGYLYQQISCDSGTGARVGCFESRVMSVGAQVGYIVPMGEVQGYLNLKAYKEFESENRPEGWNVWLTLVLSPASATPPPAATPTKRMALK